MNENYRHRQLLRLLEDKKIISTAELVNYLGVSPATARRDINKLNELGRLRKVRNGAEAINITPLTGSKEPINNFAEKQRIAEEASKLCFENESVVLTCGSTMQMLGRYLCGKNLQIITNFLPIANELIANNHEDIVIMGGQYNRNKQVTLSLNNQNETAYFANTMFTSGKGFTLEGLYKTDMIIANSEQRLLSHIGKLIVLLDSTKLGQQVGMLFSKLEHIDTLITGREADPKLIKQLKTKGLKIILA